MERDSLTTLGITALDEKLRREVKRHLWFSRFKGNITRGETGNNDPEFRGSGKPIEVNHKLKSAGIGDRLLIPMEKDLAGAPTLGDAVLIGREEPNARAYAKVGYNMVRHAVPIQEGEMSKERERFINAAESNMEKLAWWHAQYENYNIMTAAIEGASENLYEVTESADYGQGLGIPRRFHPNMYTVTGSSEAASALTKIGSAGYYPTATQMYTAASAASNPLHLNSYAVQKARLLAMRLGLRPLVSEGGQHYWPWLISPEQAYSLLTDTQFQNAMNATIWKDMRDQPSVKGSLGYFGGFVFFEDILSVRGFSGTSAANLELLGSVPLIADEVNKSNPRYLPQLGHITNGGAANHIGLIFGASFLGESLHDELAFKKESQDYDNWQGIAAKTKYGYERLDFVPESKVQYLEGTSKTTAERVLREDAVAAGCTSVYNRSSIAIMTWEEARS